MSSRHVLLVAVVTMLSSTAYADTIYVDDDACPGPGSGTEGDPYCSIQTAIDNAVDTDEIVVAPGTYLEAIDFLGKAITLRSSDGADVTIIDGTGNFHVVQCVNGEGPDTVLEGFTITGGNANGDYPDYLGGGMYNASSSPTVTDCLFSGNSAAAEGGGMYNYVSNPTVTNCTFSGNSAGPWGDGNGGSGGGMCNQYSSPTLTDCTFSGNTTTPFYGGGMYNANSSNPTLTNCTFTGNIGGYEGGGMYNNQFCNPTVTDCTFSGNTAGNGGGMSNQNSALTVTNCTFNQNTAQHGGGIRNYNGSSPTVTGCTFTGNDGGLSGGGMFNFESSPTVTDCEFTSNNATRGAGMLNQQGSHPTVTSCVFTSNEGEYGGGLYNTYGSNSTVTNCTFRYNTAGWFGGGMDNKLSAPTVTNCTFASNSGFFGGGMFNEENASPTVTNCTFIDNQAGYGGGIFSKVNSSPTLANCILWGDTPDEIALENSTITVTYSNVQGGWAGTGNIDADPTFADADGRLAPGSPCIDAADNTAVPADTEDLDGDEDVTEPVPFDLDGNPRFADDTGTPDTGSGDPPIVDMGAYEFLGTTLIVIDFDPPDESPAEGEAIRQATGDLDGNGTIDVVVVIPNEDPTVPGTVQVFLNQGTDEMGEWLGFAANAPITVGRDPSNVAAGLFNGDPHLDVAVTNAGDDSVSILLNDGLGTGNFIVQAPPVPVGDAPSGVTILEFDGDGFTDLAVTNEGDDNLLILLGDGAGGFSLPPGAGRVGFSVGSSPMGLLADDFDNNDEPDVAGPGQMAGLRQSGVVFVLLGTQGGGFDPVAVYDVGQGPRDITSGDLDGDGFSDIAAVNADDGTVSILLNLGDGTFAPAIEVSVGEMPRAIEAADLDGDSDNDLAVAADDPEIGPSVQVLENRTGDGVPAGGGGVVFDPPVAFGVNADPNFVVAADLNGDGLPDLLTANTDDGPSGG
ncbi:MAG: right-handed parallel beta-helix repeat-containing protein, partial [Planctomycetota bacterium]